jgi:hypothetical protein
VGGAQQAPGGSREERRVRKARRAAAHPAQLGTTKQSPHVPGYAGHIPKTAAKTVRGKLVDVFRVHAESVPARFGLD